MTLYSFSRLIVNEKRNGKESNIEAWKGKESLMISYQCLVWLDAGLQGIVLLHCVGTRLCWDLLCSQNPVILGNGEWLVVL